MTQLSPLPSPGQLPPEDFPYPRLRGAATRSPPQGVPHPGLPWACPGPRCRKRPCSLKAGPAQSRAHHHRPDPPGSVQKDNGASWGAGQKGPSRQTLLESHSPERPPLHISVCFCRHRSRRTPRLPRASPTPLQPLGFPVHPAPTRVPSLTESGMGNTASPGSHLQKPSRAAGQAPRWAAVPTGRRDHTREGLGHMVSTLWVIRTSQASHFWGPQGGRGKGDLRPTHPHQHKPSQLPGHQGPGHKAGPQLPTALDCDGGVFTHGPAPAVLFTYVFIWQHQALRGGVWAQPPRGMWDLSSRLGLKPASPA